MYSVIMASFDGVKSMLFGFGTLPGPAPAEEPPTDGIEGKESPQNKAYGYDAERPTRGTRLVERMDGDGDGGLSWGELGENRRGRRIARNFDKIDNDSDGKLSAAELDSFRQSRGTRLVERMDGDGDGGLSWNELGETRRGRRIASNFDKIDNDSDGKLTALELDAFRKARHAGRAHQQGQAPAEHQPPAAPVLPEVQDAPPAKPVEPADPAQQSYFFAMTASENTSAQQASSSYSFVLALFK